MIIAYLLYFFFVAICSSCETTEPILALLDEILVPLG